METLLNRAKQAHALGDLELAEALYSQILIQSPFDAEATGWLGTLYAQQKKLSSAKELLKCAATASESFDFLLSYANVLSELHEYEEAINTYEELARKWPSTTCLQNMATCYVKNNQASKALNTIQRALNTDPNDPVAWFIKGNVLAELREYNGAVDCFESALSRDPNISEAWNNLGVALNELSQHEQAIASYQKALNLKSNYAEAWNNKGWALFRLGRDQDALECYSKAITIRPDYPVAWNNQGIIFQSRRDYQHALDCYNHCISLDQLYAVAWSNRGASLDAIGNHEEAKDSHEKSLSLDGQSAESWNNYGLCLMSLKLNDLALECFEKAALLSSNDHDAWNNRGNCLVELKKYGHAIESYAKAIQLRTDDVNALSNMAAVLFRTGRYKDALEYYERAFNIKPSQPQIIGPLIFTQLRLCDWENLEERMSQLHAAIESGAASTTPFEAISLITEARTQRKAIESYLKANYRVKSSEIPKTLSGSRIRIGYFSADFCEHPVAFHLLDLIRLHDRKRFEVIGFSFGSDTQDEMRKELEMQFDEFYDLNQIADSEIVKICHSLKIHIAVDLSGHTLGSRPQIFIERVAPIQINFIGFPGSWGADCMDYFMTCKQLEPDDLTSSFNEKFIVLPSAYGFKRGVNGMHFDAPLTVDEKALRVELDSKFVYACFNANWRIRPHMFRAWCEIINEVENSMLMLYVDNESAEDNLKNKFISEGLKEERLVFTNLRGKAYLEQYAKVGLYLDTHPYSIGSTFMDSYYAKCPVLTLRGECYVSRMGAAMCKSIGMDDFVCSSLNEYKRKAVAYGRNTALQWEAREKIQCSMKNSDFLNEMKYVESVETAYLRVYHNHLNGGLPRSITIDSNGGTS